MSFFGKVNAIGNAILRGLSSEKRTASTEGSANGGYPRESSRDRVESRNSRELNDKREDR